MRALTSTIILNAHRLFARKFSSKDCNKKATLRRRFHTRLRVAASQRFCSSKGAAFDGRDYLQLTQHISRCPRDQLSSKLFTAIPPRRSDYVLRRSEPAQPFFSFIRPK
jgi:hypothetical protein